MNPTDPTDSDKLLVDEDHLNDDGRDKLHWETQWSNEAVIEIRKDAVIIGGIFFLTLAALILTWRGSMFEMFSVDCTNCNRDKFDQYAFYFLGGLLGGTLFGLKYLYRVVARGRWNVDRRLWRFFSPFLSGGLAIAIGALFDAGILGITTKLQTTSTFFSIGFISGYFADSALAKMQEIANTIFGPLEKHKHPPYINKKNISDNSEGNS